ncbi:hypothetical protein [Nitrosovibrio sp. Nv4]|uniref:hypothetical protein n=1 Tax=Nitrosovibrio sp. Nv4 TaxID=1945880 RepID=UPI000BDA06FE|nr:hypothetical protein [Nitrosovibrio sp. Nv4]SOD41608.1 hypothetical protein SAMN06298226_1910 [Nitrosovibrio sp. Nv4]
MYPGYGGTVPAATVPVKGSGMVEGLMATMLPGIAQGVGSGLAGLAGGAGGPTVSGADGNRQEAIFDNSGWNVAFGESTIKSDRRQLPELGGMDSMTMLLWLAGGVVVWKVLSKSKSKATLSV